MNNPKEFPSFQGVPKTPWGFLGHVRCTVTFAIRKRERKMSDAKGGGAMEKRKGVKKEQQEEKPLLPLGQKKAKYETKPLVDPYRINEYLSKINKLKSTT